MSKGIFKKSAVIIGLLFFLSSFPAQAYLPSDPMYTQQRVYFDYLNLPAAWDIARGDKVVVAVLDSGVDINNPDLQFNIWKNVDEVDGDVVDNDHNGYVDDISGWDFVDNDNDPSPVASEGYDKLSLNHGTALAGIIGAVANNGIGLTGIAFNSKIMPIRILQSDGEGLVSSLVEAINYAVNNGADIINLSLVGFEKSTALENAITQANKNGVLVVAASGNAESGKVARNLDIEPAYPVCYGTGQTNTVLGVTSIDLHDKKSSFANYGSSCVDLSALGEDLISLAYYNQALGLDNYYSYNWYGTSFSTAVVSGLAALIKSKNLSLSATDLTNLIINNTENIDNLNHKFAGQLGTGKINIIKSLNNNIEYTGQLIKLADASAIYYLDQNQIRHLFANQNVFWSWYDGAWADQNIEIVSQEKFDIYTAGKNITVRPGTKLIKFQNSGRIYAISPSNVLHHIEAGVLEKLYPDYASRLTIMQNSFEADYQVGDKLDGQSYPDGTLIQYANSEVIWYIENGQKREFTNNAFNLNNFKVQDIVKNISSNIIYNVTTPIKTLNFSLYPYAT